MLRLEVFAYQILMFLRFVMNAVGFGCHVFYQAVLWYQISVIVPNTYYSPLYYPIGEGALGITD